MYDNIVHARVRRVQFMGVATTWRMLKHVRSFPLLDDCIMYYVGNGGKYMFFEEEDLRRWDPTTFENETFEDLGVSPDICHALASLGMVKPNTIQSMALPWTISRKRHYIIQSETGSGKTLILLPAHNRT